MACLFIRYLGPHQTDKNHTCHHELMVLNILPILNTVLIFQSILVSYELLKFTYKLPHYSSDHFGQRLVDGLLQLKQLVDHFQRHRRHCPRLNKFDNFLGSDLKVCQTWSDDIRQDCIMESHDNTEFKHAYLLPDKSMLHPVNIHEGYFLKNDLNVPWQILIEHDEMNLWEFQSENITLFSNVDFIGS